MQDVRNEIDRAVKRIAAALVTYYVGEKKIEVPSFVANAIADASAKGIDKAFATLPAVSRAAAVSDVGRRGAVT
jgi:hypothetical protein